MCHKALRKNKRNLSETKWKDFIIDKTLTLVKSIINLLTSVAKDLMTQLQPKPLFSTVLYNLRAQFYFFLQVYTPELQDLAMCLQQSSHLKPWLEQGLSTTLSNIPNFQHGKTLSKYESNWDFFEYQVKNWNSSTNKMVFPQIGTKLVAQNPREVHWHHVPTAPALSDLSQAGEWETETLLTSQTAGKAPPGSERALPLPHGLSPQNNTLPYPKHKLEADESQWKYLKFHWKYLKFNFAISLYRRESTQTKLGTTNGVLQSSPFPTQ